LHNKHRLAQLLSVNTNKTAAAATQDQAAVAEEE